MLDPVITSEGVAVVHLFCTRTPGTDDEAVIAAVKAAQADDVQVVMDKAFTRQELPKHLPQPNV